MEEKTYGWTTGAVDCALVLNTFAGMVWEGKKIPPRLKMQIKFYSSHRGTAFWQAVNTFNDVLVREN